MRFLSYIYAKTIPKYSRVNKFEKCELNYLQSKCLLSQNRNAQTFKLDGKF